MAEIISSPRKKNKRYLHQHIRVDLTPMVDLGFLLITFFILTTTLQSNTSMKLVMPKDSIDSMNIPFTRTLAVVLEKNDSIGYHEGGSPMMHESISALRSVIQQKQRSLLAHHIRREEMILVIKPAKESSYRNFVEALDEIHINDCRTYFIADPSPNER